MRPAFESYTSSVTETVKFQIWEMAEDQDSSGPIIRGGNPDVITWGVPGEGGGHNDVANLSTHSSGPWRRCSPWNGLGRLCAQWSHPAAASLLQRETVVFPTRNAMKTLLGVILFFFSQRRAVTLSDERHQQQAQFPSPFLKTPGTRYGELHGI